MDLDAAVISQIRYEWQRAPFRGKRKMVETWADNLNCSVNTLYSYLKTGRQRRKGDHKIKDIEDAVKIVAQIKKRPPKEIGELSMDQAVKLAIENKLIPKNMKDVSISTFNRILRNFGLNKRERRIQRFQALYPNQLHHLDASSSGIFYVDRTLPDGDYVLKINPHLSKRYKNKPVKNPDRLRAWVYGLTDDYSGVHIARYVAATGESLGDNLNFLSWAWSKNEDKLIFGLPERVKADQGPMMKGKAAQDFINRLGIKIDPSPPYAKKGHGKIERPWRTQWQRFEKPFYVVNDWKNFEITLNELNRRFFIYLEELNNRLHRYEKSTTRLQAWKRINLYGGAVAIPKNAIATIAKRFERTVGTDGCFSIDGVPYEVKGLHDAKVYVYRGVFADDRMIVMDKATGKKYGVETFKPTPLDTFVAHKETPHQKAVKAGETLQLENTLYTIPKDQGNVTHFPTRTKETRDIQDPLDVDIYSSLNEAMQDFISISGELPKGKDFEDLKKLIIKNSLNRSFVRNLAFEVQAENERRELYG